MRLRLTARLPKSEHVCDIDASSDATVGELADALIAAFDPESLPLAQAFPHAPGLSWTVALPFLGALDPGLSLSAAGIAMGASVTVMRQAHLRFRPRHSLHALELVSATTSPIPLRGQRVAVEVGTKTMAPARMCFAHRGRTWHVLPSPGMRLNEHPLEAARRIEAGDMLDISGHRIHVRSTHAAPFPQPDDRGILNLQRSAPRRISVHLAPVTVPAPPEDRDRSHWPTWTVFGSLIGAGLMYLVWPQWYIVAWMAISSLWTIFSVLETRRQHATDLRSATQRWNARLDDALTLLSSRRHLELEHLRELFPSTEALVGRVRALSGDLWDCRLKKQEAIELRVGVGSRGSEVGLVLPGEIDDHKVQIRIARVNEAPLTRAPLTVNLSLGPVGICGPPHLRVGMWRALSLQLATRYSPKDCTILELGVGEGATDWLPHTITHRTRGSRGGVDQASALDALLTQLQYSHDELHLVVVAVDRNDVADIAELLPIVTALQARGAHIIWMSDQRDDVFGDATTIIDCTEAVAYREDVESGACAEIETLEALDATQHLECCRRMAALRDAATSETHTDLPDMVELHALATTRPHRSLTAPVGRSLEHVVHLDLRADGPHALVAGTTGSGKSEFLRAWICSLARDALPSEVTFVLIDYKGGAAFRECVELPHVVGMLTDLDASLAERVLISLAAEVRWRERELARAAVRDLHELEALGETTFPSLVIVIDEFATLVRDVPEFVNGVIDIAQRGRSLGIHLILATQRPSGVITDAIRANTNIRICLRVTDADDARDVVGTAEPAHIDSSIPGRAYLRIGHRPPVVFQSAYVGGTINPDGHSRVRVLSGGRVAGEDRQEQCVSTSLLFTTMRHTIDEARRRFVAAAEADPRRPWLAELPEDISLDELEDHIGGSPLGSPA